MANVLNPKKGFKPIGAACIDAVTHKATARFRIIQNDAKWDCDYDTADNVIRMTHYPSQTLSRIYLDENWHITEVSVFWKMSSIQCDDGHWIELHGKHAEVIRDMIQAQMTKETNGAD